MIFLVFDWIEQRSCESVNECVVRKYEAVFLGVALPEHRTSEGGAWLVFGAFHARLVQEQHSCMVASVGH